MKKISIVDYGSGNYNSIIGMLKKFNCETIVTRNIKRFRKIRCYNFTWVGTFPYAMQMLNKNNLSKYLKKLKK